MSTAAAGRRREWKVRDALEVAGYPNINRSAASKGAVDLIHGHPLIGAVLVQVGPTAKRINCRLSAHADGHPNGIGAEQCGRDRFCEAADLCHALPVLAQVIAQPGHRTVIRYWIVTRDEPRTWNEWTP